MFTITKRKIVSILIHIFFFYATFLFFLNIHAADQECSKYALHGISVGMSMRDVHKVMGRKGNFQKEMVGTFGPGFHESYLIGASIVEIEYISGSSIFSSAKVVGVLAREPLHSGKIVQSLQQQFSEPIAELSNLEADLEQGSATWIDPNCGIVISAAMHKAEWWEPMQDAIKIEVRVATAATLTNIPELKATNNRLVQHIGAPAQTSEESARNRILKSEPQTPSSKANHQISSLKSSTHREQNLPPDQITVLEIGVIKEPVRIPDFYVPPVYPESARRMKIKTKVVLNAVIRTDGTVGDVTILQGTGTKYGFEEAAVSAVKQWHYSPATLDGKAIEMSITIVVQFK